MTHHAEDGSGVGSAIIAGKLLLLLFLPRGPRSCSEHRLKGLHWSSFLIDCFM